MDVAVTIGSTEEDGGVHVEISDDTVFTPELASDLLRRARLTPRSACITTYTRPTTSHDHRPPRHPPDPMRVDT